MECIDRISCGYKDRLIDFAILNNREKDIAHRVLYCVGSSSSSLSPSRPRSPINIAATAMQLVDSLANNW